MKNVIIVETYFFSHELSVAMRALINVIDPVLNVAPLAPKLIIAFMAFTRSTFKLIVSDFPGL